jgi:nitroreductase/FMN reductase [NAD(P)H]
VVDSPRLPTALTVHVDRNDDTNHAAGIDGYDRRRDARHRIPLNDRHQVGRFGKPWLMAGRRKARQVSVPESQDFGAFIRREGFRLDQ